MQIVINISEEEYYNITRSDSNAFADYVSKEAMMYAIKNGTPLPKGHGRLIDADVAYDKIAEQEGGNYVDMDLVGLGLEETPTIIEAESEVEDGNT